ncbi:MAG TPA: dihydroorotate dehydrogenase-like protein [Ilumatobacteraceae bacterium]|nr:dihydroorotate dehydrogenase-like protein [Ilumatobacteraceae bacterium]
MTHVSHHVDLSTMYLGMRLHSPIVASASPVTGDPGRWAAIEEAGAGAIVLPSLFEEQIEHESFAIDAMLNLGADSYGESLSYLPELDDYDVGPARHLALVEQARNRLSIPVIASLNGTTPGGWVQYARHLESAGANAIELNVYDVIVDPRRSAADVERQYLELVEEVRAEIKVPLAVKLGPWFTSLGHFALALQDVGVDGLVLFNRLYQPDIDLETLDVTPRLQLSTAAESRLPLHWISILRGFLSCSLAATTGVHDGADAVKLLLAGADVTMTASALLLHGPQRITEMLAWMTEWMAEDEYVSVDQLRGSVSRHSIADPQVYERANYYQVLQSWRG